MTSLDAKHAFANIALTDNVVRFATRRYCDNPLIVQGPGAGPEVTAGGVFSDLLRLSAYLGRAFVAPRNPMPHEVTAFAPATVGNVAIGFDILGFAVEAVGDRVWLRRIDEPVVRIRAVKGVAGESAGRPRAEIPPGRALQAMQAALKLEHGFELDIDKGIPLGSGLGGSAASAVAAVVAANALLRAAAAAARAAQVRDGRERSVASGSPHVDNIAPCLYGGLVLTVGIDHPRVKQIPVPRSLRA